MTPTNIASEGPPDRKGLREFLTPEQQGDWVEGKANLPDTEERSESLEQRFNYVARLEKLLSRPQAQEVLDILQLYAETCTTERTFWSVSCLPSTADKPDIGDPASPDF